MRWCAISGVLLGCTRAVQPATEPSPSQAEVHALMVRRCGECHERSQATAVPAALAVFDLDSPDWPQRFDAHRFEVALARLGSEPASDRALFEAFHVRQQQP